MAPDTQNPRPTETRDPSRQGPPPETAERSDSRASEAAFAAGSPPSEGHLLRFYDRLRQQVLDRVGRKRGKMGTRVVETLLLVPDVFVLLVRLVLDDEVPGRTRSLVGGALLYFVLPVDLLPEALVGVAGYLDDVVLAAAVLAQAFADESAGVAEKHWSGDKELRPVLRDLSETAHHLLGANLMGRLKTLLAKRGVKLEDRPSDAVEGGD